MKAAYRFLVLALGMILCAALAQAQVAGDLQSKASGNWGVTSTWQIFNGTEWVDSTGFTPGATRSVFIRNSHIVTLESSGKNFYNMTIDAGGQLISGTSIPTGSPEYVRANGPSVIINGTFGSTGTPEDAIGLEIVGTDRTLTITGSGTFKPTRFRPYTGAARDTIIFDINSTFTYSGTSGTGGVALYVSNNTNDDITFIVNSGKTVSFQDYANISLGSSNNSAYAVNATFHIYGTLDLSATNNQITVRASTGKTATLNVHSGGVINLGRNFSPSTVADGGTTTIIVDGTFNTGVAGGGTADFSNPSSVITGSGTFSVSAGSTLNIGHADGLNATTGPIRTSTRTFSTGANYTYSGTAAQVTGADLPATVNNLTLNNASGLTLTNHLAANGTVTLTAGDLSLNGKTLALGTTGSLSESGGNTVGGAGEITATRTLSAPSAVNVAGLGATITSAADLGSTAITRGHVAQSGNSNTGILRFYDIAPTTNTGLSATVAFSYDDSELNGILETDLAPFKSTDGGTTWNLVSGATLDNTLNTVTLTGLDGFSKWTLGSTSAPLPVQLSSFTAAAGLRGTTLTWRTASEVDNAGFEVERRGISEGGMRNAEYQKIGFIAGAGTSTTERSYRFTDAPAPGRYAYRLRQVDRNGGSTYSGEVEVEIGLAPKAVTLGAYPNPFNPATTIDFTLPSDGQATLRVFNVLGQEVATLFAGQAAAGRLYQVPFDARRLTSGIYVARLESGNNVAMTRLTVIK
jgi:hypothetical protein